MNDDDTGHTRVRLWTGLQKLPCGVRHAPSLTVTGLTVNAALGMHVVWTTVVRESGAREWVWEEILQVAGFRDQERAKECWQKLGDGCGQEELRAAVDAADASCGLGRVQLEPFSERELAGIVDELERRGVESLALARTGQA